MLIFLFSLIGSGSEALTVDQVRREIECHKIANPCVVLAQAIIETGWFRCSGCSMDRNNLFGFRIREGYLRFDHWIDSVIYYKRWQLKRLRAGENYFDFLRRVGYAEDNFYISKLQSILQKI